MHSWPPFYPNAEIQRSLGLSPVAPGWSFSDLLSVLPAKPTLGRFASYLDSRLKSTSIGFGCVHGKHAARVMFRALPASVCRVCVHFDGVNE